MVYEMVHRPYVTSSVVQSTVWQRKSFDRTSPELCRNRFVRSQERLSCLGFGGSGDYLAANCQVEASQKPLLLDILYMGPSPVPIGVMVGSLIEGEK